MSHSWRIVATAFIATGVVAYSPPARITHAAARPVPALAPISLRSSRRSSIGMNLIEGLAATVEGVKQQYEAEVPEGYAKARHILFLAGDNDAAKAAALKRRIEAGEISFGEAALRFSSCPTRDLNGSLGTFSSLARLSEGTLREDGGGTTPYEGKAELAAPFDQLVFSADTKLAPAMHVVSTQWGTHLVLIEARGNQVADPVDQAAALVRAARGGGGGVSASGGGADEKLKNKKGFGGAGGAQKRKKRRK